MLGDAGLALESGQIAGRILPTRFLGGVGFLMLVVRGAGQQGLGGIRVDKLSPRVKDVSITVSIGDILVFEKAS
ncbi:hypothetical protein [Neorhizobium sp. LjRoot104]|uniref:hypothetical protein n=1 Tax=Neorhizobium sp. LjRoot104 TaxID=3342254 RepID=UPI003ECF0DB1